jgi:hypothetical protein
MKKLIILSFCALITFKAAGQRRGAAEAGSRPLTVTDTSAHIDQAIKTFQPANGKGNDQQLFPTLFGGFLNMFSGGSGLTLSPTLYTVTHLKKVFAKDTVVFDADYRNQTFARNLLFTLAVNPQTVNQLHMQSSTFGAKYAIINNKVIKQHEYQDALNYLKTTRSQAVEDSVNKYQFLHPQQRDSIRFFMNSDRAKSFAYLPKQLITYLQKSLNIKSIDTLHTLLVPYLVLQEYLKNRLSHKSLWTISGTEMYDYQRTQTDHIVLGTDYAFFIGKVPFDAGASITWAADTAKRSSPLVRRIYEVTFGKNITVAKWFELKPALDYIHTTGPLYKKEVTDNFAASLTPRLKINNQFWLPITIKYDVKKPQFFGLLSVQYSLK